MLNNKFKGHLDLNRQPHFFMVNNYFPIIVNKIIHEYPKALATLFALQTCSSNDGASILSQEELSKYLGYSTVTVYKTIKYLSDKGYIKILCYKGNNVYVVNTNLMWHTRENEREYFSRLMKFKNALYLTKKTNRSYFTAYKRLKHENKGIICNTETIIKNRHNKALSLSNTKRMNVNVSQCKKRIAKQIHQINLTPKELEVVKFVLKKLFLKKNYKLRKTNKDIVRDINHESRQGVSYVPVSKALLKLKEHYIIIRRHKFISISSFFKPIKKYKTKA